MADVESGVGGEGVTGNVAGSEAPSSLRGRLRVVGLGLIIAATGVGAGDLVSSVVAGTRFGTTFIWAIIIGALIKLCLVEGMGRWYMATGRTIM